MNPVLVYLIIGVVGAVMVWRLHHRTLKAPPTIVLFVLVCALFYTVVKQQQDEADEQSREEAVAEYNQCISRVDRSAGNREMWLYVIDLLSAETEIAAELQAVLDKNLPALSREDCPEP